jgi:YD repeat-containing protein
MREREAGVRPFKVLRGAIVRWTIGLIGAMAATALPAASPTVLIATAPPVDPATALGYYGSPASPTPAAASPLVVETARALRYDVDLIFAHVRDNVEFTPMFGLQEGSRGVILNGRGTAFDQAQFLVDLLREADAKASRGYNPAYQLGRIQLSAADFAAWTGVNDAAIATRLLANGGIPATVTGSGSSFTVSMLHIWVRATIGGTNYLFDPGYKPSVATAGMAWAASTGYSQTALLASAGGTKTADVVSGFSIPGFRDQLKAYRGNLESFIAANAAGKRAEAVVGFTTILPHSAAEDRRTSLPYVIATDRTWAGQIPDNFRTSFVVKLNATSYGTTYFADEIGGQPIQFSYYFNGTNFVPIGTPTTPVIAASFLDPCNQYLSNRASAPPAKASVEINHPYAANSGTYADRTIERQLVKQQCDTGQFYVTNDWGYVGNGISQRMAPEASRVRIDPEAATFFVFGPTLANIASQYAAFLDTASDAQNGVYQMHDLVGIHTLDVVSNRLTPPGQYDLGTSLSLDFEAAVSAISRGGTTDGDIAAAYTAGLGLSYAEGAVPRQETDSVWDMASLNLLTQQDSRVSTAGTYANYRATPATWASVQGSLSAYPVDATTAMSGYVGEGYSLLAPQKGALRQPQIRVESATTRISSLWEGYGALSTPAEIMRSAFLAWHPSGAVGSVPDRIAMVMYDQRRGSILKAGIGVPIAFDANNSPIRKPEAPKAEGKDFIRAALNVDGHSGAITYAPAADLTDGAGEFPRSLSLQRLYDQRDQTNYGFGMGWKHNWYQVATLSNDGQAALGRGSAEAAASLLVTLQAIGDLVTTQDAQHLYAALQVAAWMTDQTINNSIVVSRGLDSEHSFYAQANGSFANARPDGATLTLTGTPATGIINRRLYVDMGMTYTDAAGTVRSYATGQLPVGADLSSPGIASPWTRKSADMAGWAFPDGVQIWTAYNGSVAAPDVKFLLYAFNNLGSGIYESYYDFGSQTDIPTCRTPGGLVVYDPPYPAEIRYRTPAAAEARYSMDGQIGWKLNGDPDNAHCLPDSTTPSRTQSPRMSHLLTRYDSSNAAWNYGYAPVSGLFGAFPMLKTVYKPGNASPDIAIDFGGDSNAVALTNLRGKIWRYYSSAFRSEVVSPEQTAAPSRGSAVYFDRYAQPIRSVDPLLRPTLTAYDDRGRPVQVTQPEGNAVATGYDVRGNVIKQTQKAKPGSGLADLVTDIVYVTPPTTAICASPAVCNKISDQIDPRRYRTHYDWNAAGQPTLVRSGWNEAFTACAMADGCPQTSYSYGTGIAGYNPVTGGTATAPSLLVGKTETIASGTSRTTSYGYVQKSFATDYSPRSTATVKKLIVREVVTDSGGLNLRQCYDSDIGGNIIDGVEPLGTAGGCP